ncbi:MAG: nucleotide sugar dehydrogenase [Candidatus Nitrohelix vancouverensis]|uniref:Nucleotide sugar dehydrogenase n=1 Tax=Candidatus Nitrohelix vancouverensis TaxID=2705534 RepID=A0A7T0C5E6_9BACT|nr:MAG: nucleotide sugar dehydrogenase [Candidatus Nitrohelix vancouverensis]
MLIDRIQNKSATIGVIGLGYVGLPILLALAKVGFQTRGLDIDANKVDQLQKGLSYIRHIPSDSIQSLLAEKRIQFSCDFSSANELDCILICVPTPLTRHREPDLSFVLSTAAEIGPHLKAGQLIVLESTVFPGATKDYLTPALESHSKLIANKDFHVAYAPEREDPANKNFQTQDIPRVVGSDSEVGLKAACALYGSLVSQVVPVSDTMTAESAKLMENIFRSVNIALVNEMKIIFDRMGVDVWEAIDAAATKPFGFMPFKPGPGLGGHCIPIDPFYLTWKAREYGITTRFIELAGEINVGMPVYVMQKIQDGLNRSGKSLQGSRILILGLAYKKDVDDDRESVSYRIMDRLIQEGAVVEFNDPFISKVGDKREFKHFLGKQSVSLDTIGNFDMTVILTDHSQYDYEMIVRRSNIVVDTRNACASIQSKKIIKA